MTNRISFGKDSIGPFLLTAAVILSMGIRLWLSHYALKNAGPITDTYVFFKMAASPFFSTDLLAGARPPLVPLLYKLLHCSIPAIVVFQSIFAGAAWLFLAVSISRCIVTAAIGKITFMMVLLISFSEPVMVWESALISESVSISLFVVLIAAWLSYLRKPTSKTMIAIGFISLGWLFTRETNLWMTILLLPVLLVSGLFFSVRRLIVLCIVLLAGCIVCSASSSIGKRWLFPFLNVVSKRVLTDDAKTAYFVKHGMPFSHALAEMANECASCKDYRYYNDKELAPFMTWVRDKGKHVYMKWLLTHPASSLREPLSNIELMVASGSEYHYASPGSRRVLPAFLSKVLFPVGYERYFSLLMVWMFIFFSGIALGAKMWRHNKGWIILLLMSLAVFPHLFIVWHGDVVGFEMGRHALGIRIQINIALWMMVFLALDHLLTRPVLSTAWNRLHVRIKDKWLH